MRPHSGEVFLCRPTFYLSQSQDLISTMREMISPVISWLITSVLRDGSNLSAEAGLRNRSGKASSEWNR